MDTPFDRLTELPRALWLPAIVSAIGSPEVRLADLPRWRAALDAGTLPPAQADFGAADALAPMLRTIAALGLPALCAGTPALAEQLLRTLLWHLDRLIDLQPRLTRAAAIEQVTQEFHDAWLLQKADWDRLLALLQGLGELARLSSADVRGLLARREWIEAERIAQALTRLPELQALIRALGRAERAATPRALPPQALDSAARRLLGQRVVETRLPGLPGEWRGIRLTGRFEHQLGSEAALLLHPVAKKLWRARRAEARLLGYDSEAVLHDLRPDPHAKPHSDLAPPRPEALERGPIIVCLDTSGSMQGAPEIIAKAVVLETMRTAHRERRGCLLLAFGGPGELIERELGLDRAGLEALLDLLGQNFDGGTDVQAPIERAIERVHEKRWASADLLIVSDGEFGCVPATLERLDAARQTLGLRVQGILVGDRETMGLMEVADHIHWVRDWRRHGSGARAGNFSPVHSKSLTALYFPNALSSRAAKHRPG